MYLLLCLTMHAVSVSAIVMHYTLRFLVSVRDKCRRGHNNHAGRVQKSSRAFKEMAIIFDKIVKVAHTMLQAT